MLRLVFHLALRQAEGFAASVLRLLGQELRVPDHTTLSRRSRGFAGRQPKVIPDGPLHLVIDSTGQAVRPGRVERGEARPDAPVLAQAAHRRRCPYRRDRRLHADRQCCR